MKIRRILFLFVYFIFIIILFCFFAELALRIKGFQPWKPVKSTESDIRIEPGGSFYKKSSLLGYTHLPGKFKVILEDNYAFNATHLANTLRITHPLNSYNNIVSKPEIWIFGCSFAYGWSLNDEDTYPWILQEMLPDYEVVNFGVGGYSTLHALIQLKEAIKNKKPYLAIIAYASFHDKRNTFLRSRRKFAYTKLGPQIQPYARLDHKKRLYYRMATVEYSEFPLMRYSSFVSWIENKYNMIEDRFCHSHEVSKAIIQEISKLCKKHNVKLIVAGVTSDSLTEDMLKYCKKEGILTLDLSLDYFIPENNNLPIDSHPSAIANKKIGEKLYAFIKNSVLKLTYN